MRRKKHLCLLVLAIFLLLPTTAWALAIPEVTEDEERFYLEYYMNMYYSETDFSGYSNPQLRDKLKKEVKATNHSYRQFMERTLFLKERYWGVYREENLEKALIRYIVDGNAESLCFALKEGYAIQIDSQKYSPQELNAFYYKTKLEKDYGIIVNQKESYSWYQLMDLYSRCVYTKDLESQYGEDATKLKNCTLDELEYLSEWHYKIKSLFENYGVKEDLTKYTLEELQLMEQRLWKIEYLQERYGVTEDLSGYTLEELDNMDLRLSCIEYLRELGVTKDFTDYSAEELQKLVETTHQEQDEAE